MNDIAIVGMAGRFPLADDLGEFYQNLRNARESVREVSADRIRTTSVPAQVDYMPYAYLNDITRFDHSFFAISLHEAEHMDPHQRLVLEVAYATLESSGRPIDYFSNTNTSVILSDYVSTYYEFAEQFDPTLVTGALSAFAAGRVARYFNLRGMATMVNTTCSSSLVAVHMGCRQLLAAEADMVLIGGAVLNVVPSERKPTYDIGVASPDGKTRPFSADANGTGLGEGAAGVLLKRLDQALADGDPIYAIIKGSAVNQDAQLSGSLTAPSSKAQAEVLKAAWACAAIDPATISYIEAHGTATKLGDPIEIGGIETAFKEFTAHKGFCAVSSVKSNIGHTGNIAGLLSLCKVVLSLQNKELFPSINFSKPSPFLNLKNSPIYINTSLKPWDSNNQPRRAGVSSFGLMGTNCHIVVEEAPATQVLPPTTQGPWLITLSAKSATALRANEAALVRFLQHNPSVSLAHVSYTLAMGRQHYAYRRAVVVANPQDLLVSLNQPQKTRSSPDGKTKLLFLLSGQGLTQADSLTQLLAIHPIVQAAGQECLALLPSKACMPAVADFITQYAIYQACQQLGLLAEQVLGVGVGEQVVDVVTGETSLAEALAQAALYTEEPLENFSNRILKLVERETRLSNIIFVELGVKGPFSAALRSIARPDLQAKFSVVDLPTWSEAGLLQLLGNLYVQGYTPDWSALYRSGELRRIFLPAYCFDQTRCWLRKPGDALPSMGPRLSRKAQEIPQASPIRVAAPVLSSASEPPQPMPTAHELVMSLTPMEQRIAIIWQEVLKVDMVGQEDDFFKLGGHSLLSMRVISRIEKEFQVKLTFRDVYTFSTVRSLAMGVELLLQEKKFALALPPLLPMVPAPYYALSHAQRRLWILDNKEGGELISYNAPYTIQIDGILNEAALAKALRAVVERHEILRTVFPVVNGEPVQVVQQLDFQLNTENFQQQATPDEVLHQYIAAAIATPFCLATGPLLRATLIRLAPERYCLLFIIHHIVSDGWSLGVLLNDITALYEHYNAEGQPVPPPLAIQYKDYAAWHNQVLDLPDTERIKEYWHRQLALPLPRLALPLDRPRKEKQSFRGMTQRLTINAKLTQAVRTLAIQEESSLFMMLIACINVLLHKYSGSRDIIIGSPIAGRINPELESLVGFFVNTLALRNTLDEQESFLSFLGRVRQTTFEAFENQLYPLDKLVDELLTGPQRQQNPIFDVMVVLQNNTVEPVHLNGLVLTPLPLDFNVSIFDLMISIWEVADTLAIEINYNTDLFESATIALLAEHLQVVLAQVCAYPDRHIYDIEMRSHFEQLIPSDELGISFDF